MDMIMVMAILVILMVMFNHGTFGSYEPTPPPLHADDRKSASKVKASRQLAEELTREDAEAGGQPHQHSHHHHRHHVATIADR